MKLTLLLLVANASVERAFSSMEIILNALRNRIGDEFMNDCLVIYIKQDIYNKIKNEKVLQYFQKIKHHSMLLYFVIIINVFVELYERLMILCLR